MNDDALARDLEVEPDDAEHVTGGVLVYCPACAHHHNQKDPKCNSYCAVHGAGVSGPNTY